MTEMKFIEELRTAVEVENIRQEDLANAIGCSQVMVSKYLKKEHEMPVDSKVKASKYMNTSRIKRALSNELNLGVMNIEILNNVDTNVSVIIDSIEKECTEAAAVIPDLKKIFRNKKNSLDLDMTDSVEIYKHIEQLVDVYFALDIFLIKVSEDFGVSLPKLESIMNHKMKSRGYIRRD
jgi:predicted transcriptional regulator